MIRFSCPGCGAVFSVSDDKAGKTGNCPKCQTKFQIPAAEAPAPAPSPPPPPSNPFADLGDDAPKKKKPSSKADLDDDLPRKKKPSSKADLDDDEDDRPKKKPARRDDDEDDAPPPKKKPARAAVDDEDDAPPPKKKPARRDEEDDEDDRPKKKPARAAAEDDYDDEDDRPRKKAKGRGRDDDYDDDYDDRRVPKTKPGLATAAAILWLIWGAIWAVLFVLRVINYGPYLGLLPTSALMMAVAEMLFMVGGSVIAILGGVRILNSSASNTKAMGWANMIYCIVVVVGYTLLVTFVFSAVGNVAGGGQVGASVGFLAFVISCGFLLVVVSGHLLGSIFALTVNAKYEKWWRAYGKKPAARSSRRRGRDDDDDYDD